MKLTEKQVEILTKKVIATRIKNPELRIGQCYFNCLFEDYPELAEEIRGTEYDPFYDRGDKVISMYKFLNYILE